MFQIFHITQAHLQPKNQLNWIPKIISWRVSSFFDIALSSIKTHATERNELLWWIIARACLFFWFDSVRQSGNEIGGGSSKKIFKTVISFTGKCKNTKKWNHFAFCYGFRYWYEWQNGLYSMIERSKEISKVLKDL